MSSNALFRTILLGAGASAPAVPTAKDMVAKAYDALKNDPNAWEYIGAAIDVAIGGIQFRRSTVLHAPFSPIDIEELYAMLREIHGRDGNLLAPFVGSWSQAILAIENPLIGQQAEHAVNMLENDIRDNIRHNSTSMRDVSLPAFRRALRDTFTMEYHTRSSFEVAAEAILLQMISFAWIKDANLISYLLPLVESARNRAIWIASLNYDNAIELAAHSANIECDIGLKANIQGVEFDDRSPISLAKLHGSVNWKMDHDSLIKVNDLPTGNAALIFGAGNKLRVEGPYLDLLLSFRDRLNSTRCLEVCGYSFRDRHVNHIIRTWLSRHDDARLIIVDPYITHETIASNIDSTLDGGARIGREWLFKRLELKALPVDEWCASNTA